MDKAGNSEATHTLSFTIIAAPALKNISVSPSSFVYGTPATGTVTLTSAAPTGGTVVTLTSGNSVASVPANVTVPSGQSSATFTVATTQVTANTPVTLTAKLGGVTKTATITVKPAKAPQRINSGGAASAPFAADSSYSGGSTSSTTHSIITSGVANPAPVRVYQTQRWGTFTYTLSGLSPGASYTLRLHFCEITYNAAGKRIFNVSANGSPLLTNFDIFATSGAEYKAVAEQFAVTANGSGQVVLMFTPAQSTVAAVNGIEIF